MTEMDDYIKCTECGHPLERHDTTGCGAYDECTCRIGWTRREIEAIRRDSGLVGAFKSWEY
jgi:hypothetical protein